MTAAATTAMWMVFVVVMDRVIAVVVIAVRGVVSMVIAPVPIIGLIVKPDAVIKPWSIPNIFFFYINSGPIIRFFCNCPRLPTHGKSRMSRKKKQRSKDDGEEREVFFSHESGYIKKNNL
jgi:hypothetical protein